MKRLFLLCALAAVISLAAFSTSALAAVTIDTVHVGNAGNANDTNPSTGYGGVRLRVQHGQVRSDGPAVHCDFLNAVATTSDPYGLYNPGMTNTAQTYGLP